MEALKSVAGLFGGIHRRYTAYILGKTPEKSQKKLSPFLSIDQISLDKLMGEKNLTRYQALSYSLKEISFWKRLRYYRDYRAILRPYLTEQIASGDRFNLGAFFALLLMLSMFALWAYSSRGMFTTFFKWVTGRAEKGTVNMPITISQQTVIPRLVITSVPVDVNVKVVYPEPTIYPTYTPYPTPTRIYRSEPGLIQTPMPDFDYDWWGSIEGMNKALEGQVSDLNSYDVIEGKYSYYWPPLGGINCDYDCNILSDGKSVKDFIGGGWACASDFDLGQIFYVEELGIYGVCVDRGGAIVKDGDRYWFDHLNKYPQLNWSSSITIRMYK